MAKPISAYPPEFFTAWELALAGSLRISFPSRGKATNFKARLYSFRKALSAENPAQASEFYKIDLDVQPVPDSNEWVVVVARTDWKAQLDSLAAIKLPLDPAAQAPTALPPGAPAPSLDETLSNLGFSSK